MIIWIKTFFFFNVSPLVKRGQEKVLTFNDLLPVPRELRIDKSQKAAPINTSSPKIFLKCIVIEQKKIVFTAWSFNFLGIIASLLTPLLINKFITQLTALSKGTENYEIIIPVALSIGLIGILTGVANQHNYYGTLRACTLIVARLNRLIFEQALKLSQSASQKVSVGDVVNHMSSDTEAISDVPMLIGDLGAATLLIVGSISLLFYYLGWTALIAVVILILLSPVTRLVAKKFMHLDDEMMKKRDQRVGLMAQILPSMRLIKYFVWEKEISNQISKVRNEEIKIRKSLAKAELLSVIIFMAISTLVLFVALWIHVLRGEILTPALVLTCVSLFGLLQDPIGQLPGVFSRIINSFVAGKRIISFLETDTVGPRVITDRSTMGDADIIFKDVDYETPSKSFKLHNLNFLIKNGSTVAIVGEVGSGKTTLLHLILQEIKSTKGQVQLSQDNIGYVGQESYIMNASVLENLTMGKERISSDRIHHALYVTAMDRDISNLPGGLLTEIGEKGVNLSGGQKQRLSLGRCFLQDPDLILLDDPLSAVDVHTENFLVEHLILHAWKEKTVVIATHRLEALGQFDRILFLNDGHIEGDGTLSELLIHSELFKHFYSHHLTVQTLEHSADKSDNKDHSSIKVERRIMSDEDREQGAVKGSLYWDYVRALGGDGRLQKLIMAMLLLGALSTSALPLLSEWWLSWFTGHPEKVTAFNGVMIYGIIAVVILVVLTMNQIFWLQRGIKAGVELHDKMLASILKAPVRFFDSTPVGRLLQRFSRDLESVDIQLQWSFESAMHALFKIIVSVSLIIITVPFVLLIVLPASFIFWRLQLAYRISAREVKRIDSVARSPRYAHFKETLGGLPIIRAYKKEAWFREQFFDYLEKSQKAYVNNFLLNRWFSIRIPFIGGLVSCTTAICLIFSVKNGQLSASTAGLVVIYSLSFWGALNWGIRVFSELESKMTSIERIRFMTQIPSEKQFITKERSQVSLQWPRDGRIKFTSVHARYDESLPEVVKSLSVDIPGGSQVGIIGRTGAGKTTIFQMLFRFINLHKGMIEIDGVDIASVDLETLRSRLAIIPQDPTLFTGTLRSNLDPYSRKSDQDIWRVLKETGMQDLVESFPLKLFSPISDGGANLSQGQRQLFCLGRALLLDAKIIMLDEATASVDVVSDAKIQKILRCELKDKTVLVIAHRLGTVADLDYLMVMNDGRLESFSEPTKDFLISKTKEFGLEDDFLKS